MICWNLLVLCIVQLDYVLDVCMFVCLYSCIYRCKYVFIYVCTYVCIYTCMYVGTQFRSNRFFLLCFSNLNNKSTRFFYFFLPTWDLWDPLYQLSSSMCSIVIVLTFSYYILLSLDVRKVCKKKIFNFLLLDIFVYSLLFKVK